VDYVFRHVPPAKRGSDQPRSTLSGWGVALDLKKTDYLAVDDRRSGGGGQRSGDDGEVVETVVEDLIMQLIETYPVNETAPDANVPLSAEEIQGSLGCS
jgi:UDP-glucose:glycoprotein glucosyltransferase